MWTWNSDNWTHFQYLGNHVWKIIGIKFFEHSYKQKLNYWQQLWANTKQLKEKSVIKWVFCATTMGRGHFLTWISRFHFDVLERERLLRQAHRHTPHKHSTGGWRYHRIHFTASCTTHQPRVLSTRIHWRCWIESGIKLMNWKADLFASYKLETARLQTFSKIDIFLVPEARHLNFIFTDFFPIFSIPQLASPSPIALVHEWDCLINTILAWQ